MSHLEVDDCWYSCAATEDCCDDNRQGGPCDCGADRINAYLQKLEDACLTLWAELPVAETKTLREDAPALADFLAHLHHSIEHEQAMVRVNVWSQPIGSGSLGEEDPHG